MNMVILIQKCLCPEKVLGATSSNVISQMRIHICVEKYSGSVPFSICCSNTVGFVALRTRTHSFPCGTIFHL